MLRMDTAVTMETLRTSRLDQRVDQNLIRSEGDQMKDCLFIHIPKTGGTSLTTMFNVNREPNRKGHVVQAGRVYFFHGTLDHIKSIKRVSNKFLDNAIVFTWVRNPYDRAVSHYAFSKDHRKWRVNKNTTFTEYCKTSMQQIQHHGPMCKFIGDNKIDFIGRFENFNEDVVKLSALLEQEPPDILQLNTSKRPMDYRKLYTPEAKRIVESFFSEDFKRFGYETEEW